jgi:hypothetical protein
MTEPIHATVAAFRMQPSTAVEQRDMLRRVIVPGVRQAPGVVTRRLDERIHDERESGIHRVRFAEAAHSFAAGVRGNGANQNAYGVEFVSIKVVEITAST